MLGTFQHLLLLDSASFSGLLVKLVIFLLQEFEGLQYPVLV